MKLRFRPAGVACVLFALGPLVLGLLLTTPAHAQLRRVLELNRQAMEAYTNLEIEQAMDLLLQAEQAARSANVDGAPLARTYVNLGVVSIGGFNDNGQGLQYFQQALEVDPSVQLDPLTSSPDITSVFTLARNRGGGGSAPLPQPTAGGPGVIPHRPIAEQLKGTALPVFIEAPDDAPIGNVYVYYKAPGMRDFRRMQMRRMTGGFGLELPCGEVFAPRVEYYVVAFGADNATPIGTAGDPERPFSVSIVDQRNLPPPSLPGAPPPEQCENTECPPGMPGCEEGGSAGLGDTCSEDAECRSGLVCDDDFCVEDDDGSDDDDESIGGGREGQPWFFLHAGFSLGVGYAGEGKLADSEPSDPNAPMSYVPDGVPPCPDDGDSTRNSYCVRVEQPGFLLAPALRFTLGIWVIPRLAVAFTLRYQLDGGQGTLANMLLGLRLQYQLSKPSAKGLNGNLHVGGSYGQIQLRPPQNGAEEPYIISGLNGVQVGGTLGYRFVDNFGIHVTPEVHLLFPTFLFALDLTAGVEVAF